ncbi:MAG: hypothetical protein NVS9B4_17310 [Candidatus Acidiferrum sp.]
MKRFLHSGRFTALLMGLLLCSLPRANAQMDSSIHGQILDIAGAPWANMTVQAVSEQGGKSETKTDKKGNYAFHNLRSGVYDVVVVLPPPSNPFPTKIRVQGGEDAKLDVNFKEIASTQAGAAEQVKKQEEEKSKFEGMKAHFTAGGTFLDQERQAAAELKKAPADQRSALKDKVTTLSNQAVNEFQAAQKATSEQDPNQALIWARLGEAYDVASRNDEAIGAYQKAIALKPTAGYYNNLGNVQARAGKLDDARSSYTKSAELDPPNAASAWRNFGISLYNAGRLKEAVEPLKKSTDLDPKSAQGWYLLGAALVGAMETKMVGDKMEVIIQPGTVEAYKKAMELDPNGTYGVQAKQGLDALEQISPGIDTKVNQKKKKS